MKLDLACGQNKQPGFKGVDIAPGAGVDFVVDLEQFPWKEFQDGSIEEFYASHYIEHTPDLMKFMDEIWRIAEDGAKVTFVAPYYTSIRAWQDPTHKRAISEATWMYFNKGWRVANRLDHYPIKSNFDIIRMTVFFNPPWDKKTEEARQFAQQHYWNVVSDILIELKAIK
ncbi:hypothetical protein HY250_04885 [Candidatus Azambacteria bacterium]|nr:hypothetical protein [Candidatus Azambacteria bacterium]MBI3685714.1 hypothetical protein [Candidatus Azambacteria bacterium]